MIIQSKFACDMGLGGGMVWSLETDDFQGHCHGERFPIIKTIYRTLVGRYPTYTWHPAPPRSTSNQVCDFYKPTWVPQPPVSQNHVCIVSFHSNFDISSGQEMPFLVCYVSTPFCKSPHSYSLQLLCHLVKFFGTNP